ncbi:MAG: hypothetical protein IAF02_23325, partial [Anaerolineae bacterium]|nr:hypothetical protein [Anaerolineae bacterium]
WLVQTKLYPPQLRVDAVPRYRLSGWLAETAVSTPVTLISAPAGYGKTTLCASLTLTQPDVPLAWLSLDEDDNDVSGFMAALIGALQVMEPAFGATAQRLLPTLASMSEQDNGRSEIRRFMGVLLNDVVNDLPDEFVLVLDDLHVIGNGRLLLALDYLLERLPSQMHLVLAVRRDPPLAFPRLRARQQLAELRLIDMRFTQDEAEALFNDSLAFGLSADELNQLQSSTEGWAAGLSLFANSLAPLSPQERSEWLTHLSQSHRHIFDYLAEEVLYRQSPEIQQFLLQTSILQELTPALCGVVTGRSDTAVLLESLYQRNVFVLAVQEGNAGAVYRYHALFANFLRHVLLRNHPDQVSVLHQRAATAVATLQRKIYHLGQAGLWDEMAVVISEVGEEVIRQGRLDTLVSWIRTVPEDTASQHPSLAYFQGLVAIQKGELELAEHFLNDARQAFAERGDKVGLGAALASLGSVAFLQLRPDVSLEMVALALALPLTTAMHVQALMTRASINLFVASDWFRSAVDLDQALSLVQSSQDELALLVLTFYLGQEFLALPGVLEKVEAFYQEIEADLGDVVSPIRLGVADVLTYIYLRRGQLTEAIVAGQQAVVIKDQLNGYPFLGMNAAVTVASAFAVNGRYQEADQYLKQAQSQYDELEWNQITGFGGLFTLARIRWLQGRVDEVRQVYEQMHIATKLPTMPAATVLRLLVKGLLALSGQDLEQAERSFQEAVTIDADAYVSSIYCCPQLLLAHLYWRRQRFNLAWKTFAPILRRCEVENTPGVILQEGALAVPLLKLANTHETGVDANAFGAYAERLLLMLETAVSAPPHVSSPIEENPLTEREMDVLQLLAQGASNRMIADALVVSLPTVKSHVSHILSKLHASSRGEAVALARNQQLI